MTRVLGSVCALATVVCLGGAARGQVTEVDIGINPGYEQTGPTTVTSTGGFFSARVFLTNVGDDDGGTLTFPGAGSPAALTPAPGTILAYAPPTYPTLSALNAAYPMGTYTFDVTNSMTSASATYSIDYAQAADSNVPQLIAASYDALQGLNSADGVTLNFNSIVPAAAATGSYVYVNIDDSSGDNVYSASGPDGTTSVYVPGGTLASGQTYTVDLLFDDYITGSSNGAVTTAFFDTHTDVAFQTASAPEPATWSLMLLGVGAVGAGLRRKAPQAPGAGRARWL